MDPNSLDNTKKIPLENLSKDELIKKCKTLLTIAQKAKTTKDSLQQENNELKEQLNRLKNDGSREIIENLTQQKLTFVTTIEELKNQNKTLNNKLEKYLNHLKELEEKNNRLDNENISFKRQVKRLTDENEDLINQSESIEKQLNEMKKTNDKLQEKEEKLNDNNTSKLNELQNMLSISLNEIKKLQNDKTILTEKFENIQINLNEKDKSILIISQELKTRQNELKEQEIIREKLKEKLKFYHSKIVKLAGNIKLIKDERNNILELFKNYIEQVKEWKLKLNRVSQELFNQITKLESENLELTAENQLLKENNSRMIEQLEAHKTDDEKMFDSQKLADEIRKLLSNEENYKKIVQELRKEIEELNHLNEENQKEMTELRENQQKEVRELNEKNQKEIRALTEKNQKESNQRINELSKQLDEYLKLGNPEFISKELEEKKSEIQKLKKELENSLNKIETIREDNKKTKEEIDNYVIKLKKNEEFIEEIIRNNQKEIQELTEKNRKEIEINSSTKNEELIQQLDKYIQIGSPEFISRELEEKKSEIEKFHKELENLKKELEKYQNENQTMKEDKNKIKQQVENYSIKLKENEELREEIKTRKKQELIEKNVNEIEVNSNQKIEELTKQLEEYLKLGNVQEVCEKLENQKSDILKLKEELEKYRKEIDARKEDNKKLTETIENYEIKLKQNEELREEITRNNQNEIQELIEKNQKEFQELTVKNLKEIEIKFQQINEELTKQLEDYLKLGSVEEILKELEGYKSKVEELKKELEMLKAVLEKSQNENDNRKEDNKKLAQEIENYAIKLKENEELREEFAKNNLKELEGNEIKSKEKIEELNKHLAEYRKLGNVDSISKELEDYKSNIEELRKELEISKEELEKSRNENNSWKEDNKKLIQEIENYAIKLKEKEELCEEIKRINQKEIEELQERNKELEGGTKELQERIKELEERNGKLLKELKNFELIEKRIANETSEEILKLVQENKELTKLNNQLTNELMKNQDNSVNSEIQTDQEDYQEIVNSLKRENSELLLEMNEMNQALKERGENISKLQVHCDEIMKKLQIYETQANKNVDNLTEKEETIKNLERAITELKEISESREEELNRLKSEKGNGSLLLFDNDDNNDQLSTTSTTISRNEELNRLKDLESSWEERYNKLRNLAIKLKGKIRELTQELSNGENDKLELDNKNKLLQKNLQTLQLNYEKLSNQFDDEKELSEKYLKQIDLLNSELIENRKELNSNKELITELNNEKLNTELWKKQVSNKIQMLRKEVDQNNLLRSDYDNKLSKLNSELEMKQMELKNERELHMKTQKQFDSIQNELKKNTVINLEIQDYERNINELSSKLSKRNEEILQLKQQFDLQKTTMQAIKEENKLYEERIANDANDLTLIKDELSISKKQINDFELNLLNKDEKIHDLSMINEDLRRENEELSLELSKIIKEHEKIQNGLKNDKEELRKQNLLLQQNLRELQDNYQLKMDELRIIESDYNNYKVRAQSVLKQNQKRDVGLEEKLNEQLVTLQTKIERMQLDINDNHSIINQLKETNEKLSNEKKELTEKYQELQAEIEDLKNSYEQLSVKNRQTIEEHAETVRGLKIHSETLAQCYRQQLSEQEVRHNREIIELQSKLEKAPAQSMNEQNYSIPIMPPREEGEGSESIDSSPNNNNNKNIQPIPLERLLSSLTDSDQQELQLLKKQLTEYDSKLLHLTALLADTEQDLAKHVQMNKVLKEEIRRQQRSVEREKHAENLEYLKNVVFKFVTLQNGDERTRLIPVLNTILKLSPEETQKLNLITKGDQNSRGWSNYLPSWHTPPK